MVGDTSLKPRGHITVAAQGMWLSAEHPVIRVETKHWCPPMSRFHMCLIGWSFAPLIPSGAAPGS